MERERLRKQRDRLHNLRPVDMGGRDNLLPAVASGGRVMLRPTGRPRVIDGRPWRQLTVAALSTGERLLVLADGRELAVLDISGRDISVGDINVGNITSGDINVGNITDGGMPAGKPVTIGMLNAEALCATAGHDRLTVMTEASAEDWHYAGGEWVRCDAEQWPTLMLKAEEADDITAMLPTRTLSATYAAAGQALRDSDRRAVEADMERACEDIMRQAETRGLRCAPAVARYKLIGHDGSTLYESVPVLLSAAGMNGAGAELTMSVRVTSGDRRTLRPAAVSLRAWRPVTVWPSEGVPKEWEQLVDHVETELSEPLWPWGAGRVTVETVTAAGSEEMLRVTTSGDARGVQKALGTMMREGSRGLLRPMRARCVASAGGEVLWGGLTAMTARCVQ